ncbi:MAG: hypothetical protein AB1416_11970, partial [Actinomycetota bacterium]
RVAVTVAVVLCAVGLAVTSLVEVRERAVLLFLGGAGWVALGAYHRTRHASPVGALAVIVGATYLVARLDEAGNPLAYTVGGVISMIDVPPVVLVLIAFPAGRLSTSSAAVDPVTGRIDPARVRRLRAVIHAAVAWALITQLWVLFDRNPDLGCPACPARNHLIADLPAAAIPLQIAQGLGAIAILVLTLRAFERGYRNRGALVREAHIPVRLGVWMIALTFAALLVSIPVDSPDLSRALSLVTKVAFMLLPFLYGFGLHRWHELEAQALAGIEWSAATGRDAVEDVLRRELRDPGLRILPPTLTPPAGGLAATGTQTPLTGPGGRMLGVALHSRREPDSALLDRALAWAVQRLTPAAASDGGGETAWHPRVAELTDAELLTAVRLSEQWTNKQIAEDLVLAVGTVNNRVSRIYGKLELHRLSRRERAAAITRLGPVIREELTRRTSGIATM